MKKLRYGMVGGGPGSFIGDAHLLEPLMQSRDHPASLSSEQSLYLKGDILQIL